MNRVELPDFSRHSRNRASSNVTPISRIILLSMALVMFSGGLLASLLLFIMAAKTCPSAQPRPVAPFAQMLVR